MNRLPFPCENACRKKILCSTVHDCAFLVCGVIYKLIDVSVFHCFVTPLKYFLYFPHSFLTNHIAGVLLKLMTCGHNVRYIAEQEWTLC